MQLTKCHTAKALADINFFENSNIGYNNEKFMPYICK